MRRVVMVLVGVVVLATMLPEGAAACVYHTKHGGAALPPCEAEDNELAARMIELNARTIAQIGLLVGKVAVAEREVSAMQAANDETAKFEEKLRSLYGEEVVDPLLSLAEAEGVSELLETLTLNTQGQLVAGGDARLQEGQAEAIFEALSSKQSMSLIYGDARLGSGGRMSDRELTAATQAQFSAMRDYRALTYALLDTLAGEGAQRAGRYQTTTDVAGLSEAKLSALESALTYNRILTAEMQLRGITGQLNALGESQRTSGRLNDAQAPKGGP